ncbi:DMT family transporter [Psychrobacter sanguinis]|uniref:DMT family transporter n=1 Tax=Psychrobacter sanguinis TaxID=861445 RepID=UPI002A75B089|nr:DMT family transporter [Psychrobacter sanguinis]MDY3305469.1 DMT family transporter [Psychrobacter sanguinis]
MPSETALYQFILFRQLTAVAMLLPLSLINKKQKLFNEIKWHFVRSHIWLIGVVFMVISLQFNIGAIFALLVAATIAINNLLVRKLPQNHTVYQTLLLTNLVGTPTALVLALWENSPFSWESLTIAALSNVFILIYAGICVEVYKNIEAHKVSSAEYSGLLVAVIVGIIWFNEVPNLSLLVGGTLIVAPLIWLANAERVKYRNLN